MSKLKEADLRDEEDDRREALQKAFRLYAKAQEAYYTKGPSEQQLRRFEEAEAALGQQLQGGLMGLRENELELVLKGRLHQAVITAHLQESPDCWQKVKALVEDVLQYDFQNCHARWLRGLSLLHGFQRQAEAKEEMLRAVESAKRQGKVGEVKQWMDQIRSSFSDMPEEEVASSQPEQKDKEKEANGSGGGSSGSGSKQQQQQQKKKGDSGAEDKRASQDRAQEPAKQAGGSSSSSSGSNKKKSSTPEEQRVLEEKAQELQKQVAKLQQDLDKAHRDHEAQRSARESEHLAEVQTLVQHFEELFEQPETGQRKPEEAEPLAKPVADLCTTVGKLKEQMQADKLWLEGGHQKYVDFSTELLTLREMSAREWKERSDASKKHITDLQDLGQKLTELKGTARAVREHIKTLTAAADDSASLDEQHFARCAARFHALPLRLRLQGFLEDVVVLRLLLFVVIAGMLTMLAFSVEVFGGGGRQQCRLACTGAR